jgi:acyl-[acyl-carrier-protein] desaturase
MDEADRSSASQREVLRGSEGFVAENLALLLPVSEAWQPTDYLPDLTREDWREQVQRLREPAAGLSDPVLVVLVADMITEEALPSYATTASMSATIRTFTGGWFTPPSKNGRLRFPTRTSEGSPRRRAMTP